MILKWLFDRIAAFIGLLFLWPVLLIVAISVKAKMPGLWDVLIGNMSFVGPRPDVPGYADKLQGDDRDVLKLRPGITGPATLKYRLEDEMLADVRRLMSEV